MFATISHKIEAQTKGNVIIIQGRHGTGKIGNLVTNFFQTGRNKEFNKKHGEFGQGRKNE